MTDDIPVEIVLHPPTTDLESSIWGSLAASLYHEGLIWRDFQQTLDSGPPPFLRVCCTFTDLHAFESWRSNRAIKDAFAQVLATGIDVSIIQSPWAKHERRCTCADSSQFILRGHGFGANKAVIFCGHCQGYYPRYRVQELLGEAEPGIETWARVTGHVYQIWLLTGELEDWALNELTNPTSATNVAGLKHAHDISAQLGKPVWHYMFVSKDKVCDNCARCGARSEPSLFAGPSYVCQRCRLIY